MTASVSNTELAALIADLTPDPMPARVTPKPSATPAPDPCDDPFCFSAPGGGCGFPPIAHMKRSTGGLDIVAASPAAPVTVSAPVEPSSTLDEIAPSYAAAQPPPHALPIPRPITDAPAGPPPSTIAEMRDVLTALDANRPRSRQTALGPSELGTPCLRQIAAKLVGLPRQPEDKRPPWAPMQGTAMHTLMEEALRFHNAQLGRERWIVEERLVVDPGLPGVEPITGHGDAYDTDADMVVDWKYVGVTTLREVKRKTIPNEQLVKPDYRVQAHLYGYGHERAGRTVRWVRLVFLARSHDYADSTEWTERYDPGIAMRAIDRYYSTVGLIEQLQLATNPALWPVVPAAPGKACDWCPFRRVGGPADATGCPGNTDSKIDKQVAGLIA